ncbi:DUF397 domain-containing protein [Kitasatospora sp. NPDC048286]|uniref:DUF397 domain-containing protein n=1 Tax=unclassified Kitasatospora TaxID=2633591 RepID=UPI0037184CA0
MRDRCHETVWRKSTYSNGQGDCIEVAPELHGTWRKSSAGNGDGDCGEVAEGVAGVVPVRDSKDPHGPVLRFAPEAWRSFVAGVQAGDFPASS